MPDKYRVSDAVPKKLVVVPNPPDKEVTGAVPLKEQTRSRKKPVDQREYPAARGVEGKPSREEIRRETVRKVPSRQSPKAMERSSQPRSGKPGTRPRKAE